MSPDPLLEAVTALSQFLVADASMGDTLHRVTDLTLNAIKPAEFAGITMLSDRGQPTTAVFTDERLT